MAGADAHSDVKEYYGKELNTSDDLQTRVCCVSTAKKLPQPVKEVLALCHDEVVSKFYGCGTVFPQAVEGCSVLDLGCGSGLDCFVLSKLVGQKGHVTGVDMTREQLGVAIKHTDYHMKQFGYSEPNVDFREGYIEKLRDVGLVDDSYDIIISNCVFNLVPNKSEVLREAYRVLKQGGELYFSDVYTDRPIPEDLSKDKVLWGECISGALEWRELMRIATDIGFAPPVLVETSPSSINNSELEKKLGDIHFCSATYRLFKIDSDVKSVDPTVQVQYKGTIAGCEDNFPFSYNITISACCPIMLPSSVAQLLLDSRFAPHFTFKPSPGGGGIGPVAPGVQHFLTTDPFQVKVTCTDAPVTGKGCCS